MSNQSLKGKVAVVGGASKNLGSLICKTLGERGAAVVVHYNSASSKTPAEETVKAVKTGGGDAFAIQGDLTKVSEVVRLFDEAVKRFGHPTPAEGRTVIRVAAVGIAVNAATALLFMSGRKRDVNIEGAQPSTTCTSGTCRASARLCRRTS